MAKKRNFSNTISIVSIVLLCAIMAVLDFVPITYTKNEVNNRLISDLLPPAIGAVAVIWLMIRGETGLFGRAEKLLYWLPALLVAVNNFPFHAYFANDVQIANAATDHIILFGVYCLCVGIFEECIFRGILFPILAGTFTLDRKGFLKAYFLSSVLFGAMHLFNLLAGAGIGPVVMQMGYSTLTGGLFAFVLIKTKNILFPAFTHALYNFGGLILNSTQGLGATGSIFDVQTGIAWAVVGVLVGAFVLYSVWKYPDSEREKLYEKLGFGVAVKSNEK